MTLTQFVSTYTGQYVQFDNDTVDKGQCLPLVQVYMQQVQGIANPPPTPSAKNYWLDFDALGLGQWFQQINSSPQAGDIAVYNGHGTFTDGHIAVCVGGGVVFEQNADPDGSPAHTYTRANTYLLGYLRQGEIMETFNEGDRANINVGLFGYDAGLFETAVGTDWKTAIYAILQSADFKNLNCVNQGDVDNINNVLGGNASSTLGEVWKAATYNYILKNIPAGGVTSVVINGKTYVAK